MELKRFCPGLKVLTYYGSIKERKVKRVGWTRSHFFHVCITSYQLAVTDAIIFKRKQWGYLILDEAHNIKNFKSQRWQTLLSLNAAHRLLLTGTPLQNHLGELWSLLHFLQPNAEDALEHNQWHQWLKPIDQFISSGQVHSPDEVQRIISKLHAILRPYLLRRLKIDVETQIPAKKEHVLLCPLSKRQRYLYDEFLSRSSTKETMVSGQFFSIINCLMQLRKVCNHPDLFAGRPIWSPFVMPVGVGYDSFGKLGQIQRLMFPDFDYRPRIPKLFQSFWTVNYNAEHLDPVKSILSKQLELETELRGIVDKSAFQTLKQAVFRRKKLLLQRQLDRWTSFNLINQHRLALPSILDSSLVLNLRLFHSSCFGVLGLNMDVANKFALCTDKVIVKQAMLHEVPGRSMLNNLILDSNCLASHMLPSSSFATLPSIAELQSANPLYNTQNPLKEISHLTHQFHTSQALHFPDKFLIQHDCGKLQVLSKLLPRLQQQGHRVLLFTQMTRMLNVLEYFLNLHGLKYLRLDGSTKPADRQLLTDRFNRDTKLFCFISSTRAGGVGINLTGADTVIFYDSDWNPAMDAQAQDRVHRIGQTRDVHIYRLISEHTVEENILRKAREKQRLDQAVIQDGEFNTEQLLEVTSKINSLEDPARKVMDWCALFETSNRKDMENALTMVEDVDDVEAMKSRKKEMEETGEIDATEIQEKQTTLADETSEMDQDSTLHLPPDVAPQDEEEEDQETIHSIEDYMFRFKCHEMIGYFDPTWLS
jgi:helicase SWR1